MATAPPGAPPPKRQRTVLEDAVEAPDPVSRTHAAVDAVVIGFLDALTRISKSASNPP